MLSQRPELRGRPRQPRRTADAHPPRLHARACAHRRCVGLITLQFRRCLKGSRRDAPVVSKGRAHQAPPLSPCWIDPNSGASLPFPPAPWSDRGRGRLLSQSWTPPFPPALPWDPPSSYVPLMSVFVSSPSAPSQVARAPDSSQATPNTRSRRRRPCGAACTPAPAAPAPVAQ